MDWPVTLPQSPLIEGYSRTSYDGTIQFETDIGSPKVRNDAVSVPDSVTERYYLESVAQYTTLKDFYDVDTAKGTITFFKDEPETGNTLEYRLTSAPEFSKVSADAWVATCKMEILP